MTRRQTASRKEISRTSTSSHSIRSPAGSAARSGKKPPKKPRLYLHRQEGIGKGLKAIATLQLESAIAELKGKNVSPRAIHNVRTTIKKVRSIIELTAPSFTRTQRNDLTGMLRDAASRIAPLRDSEVLLNTFDLLLERKGLPQEEFTALRDGLADSARQRRSNDTRQIPHVIRLLKEILRSIPKWSLDELSGKDLRRRIRRTYRRGRSTLELCATTGDEDQFHTWRKQVKQLWYQLRITSRHWADQAKPLISDTGTIGESAGSERDLTLLSHWLKKGPKKPSSDHLKATIDSLLPQLRKKAISAGEKFYEIKPKQFVADLDL